VKEAGKTIADGVSEVREAVDFCRYYADQAEELVKDNQVEARGVILCISPWNFPLAIFLGQVSAAVVTGNTVIAKPAEQTSLIAIRAVGLMLECGFPKNVVQLVIAPGKPAGEELVPDNRIKGLIFTGSTATSRWLASRLAGRTELDIPLIAETGGQNVMIVDSTALPEQVVDDVISSGFQSAGQRCSACRVLFLQEEIAPQVITMLKGAMSELSIGDPALLSTDVGPVIDEAALARLRSHCDYLVKTGKKSKLLYQCDLPESCTNGHFFAPRLYEIADLSVLRQEVFGPIVHVIRYRAEELDSVIDQVNATGYGLTLGVHSRIQTVAARIAARVDVGNIYINRNMIGAVVGVQPFGGRGLSGTGPKAGGPHYLSRLVKFSLGESTSETEQVALPPTNENSRKVAENAINKAVQAQSNWEVTTILQRNSVIRRFLSHLVEAPGSFPEEQINDLLNGSNELMREAEINLAEAVTLPGPTGESNQLYLESRGIIALVLDEGTQLTESLKLVFSALLAGNAVIILADQSLDRNMDNHINDFIKSGLPEKLLTRLPYESARLILTNPGIHGVLVTVASESVKDVQRLLATSEAALIPLIREHNHSRLLNRLVVEKTITIDTTAAGGNASLMAAAG
jgi:RHH-type proline utilization regulon transcriptional repressor/proline dehydrogenase/delta 1-pyrroline-5-carboxylate dehydrogenase